MNQKHWHNLSWIPAFIIGLGAVGLGISWLSHPEPWILDQPPNEALLQTTFADLFTADINRHLPDYLRMIYRFFGWWVVSIGLLIMTFVKVTRMGTSLARNSILGILLIILIGIYLWSLILSQHRHLKLLCIFLPCFGLSALLHLED